MRSLKERISYSVNEEVDVYINFVQEDVITDPNVRKFVIETVIPRFNRLRDIISTFIEEQN